MTRKEEIEVLTKDLLCRISEQVEKARTSTRSGYNDNTFECIRLSKELEAYIVELNFLQPEIDLFDLF